MMATIDDLSPLKTRPFSDAIGKLEDLMTQDGKTFLLGAGCSRCAGLPLTAELTSKALTSTSLDEQTREVLRAIESHFVGATDPSIEDYLSELVDLLAIAERRSARGASKSEIELAGKNYIGDTLREAVEQIKRAIADVINQRVSIDTHWSFVKAVHRPMRPGKPGSSQPVDYLVLNYDTLIEDSLALEKVPYVDGLHGGATGWWDATVFDRRDAKARVLKLHGSINWSELPSDPLPRRIAGNVDVAGTGNRRIMIWPASTKYRETQRDPYSQLANLARISLRPPGNAQRTLVVCGYRFGDSHINLELNHALLESAGKLTVVVFWSDEELNDVLKQWHDDKNVREQVLIYGKRAFWHGNTVEKATADLPWWKFENIARLLAGER